MNNEGQRKVEAEKIIYFLGKLSTRGKCKLMTVDDRYKSFLACFHLSLGFLFLSVPLTYALPPIMISILSVDFESSYLVSLNYDYSSSPLPAMVYMYTKVMARVF
jgi:hypothetical protein